MKEVDIDQKFDDEHINNSEKFDNPNISAPPTIGGYLESCYTVNIPGLRDLKLLKAAEKLIIEKLGINLDEYSVEIVDEWAIFKHRTEVKNEPV